MSPPESEEFLKDAAFDAGFVSCDVAQSVPPGPRDRVHWMVYEGKHEKYTDEHGRYVENLLDHRLAFNHVLDENSPSRLQISQYNNYGLAPEDPRRNKRLIRRVASNRKGVLRLYFNSQNDIRNVATGYGPKWANDTWPHFLVVQGFQPRPPLSDFGRIVMTLDIQVLSANQLSAWPTGLPDSNESQVTILMYFLLRERQRPDRMIWVGQLLYCNHEKHAPPVIAREQCGIAFYRRLPDAWKNTLPAIGETRSLEVDVRMLLREAIAQYDRIGSDLSKDPDAYDLEHWNFGFEIIGHWESELVLSNVSLRGESRCAS